MAMDDALRPMVKLGELTLEPRHFGMMAVGDLFADNCRVQIRGTPVAFKEDPTGLYAAIGQTRIPIPYLRVDTADKALGHVVANYRL